MQHSSAVVHPPTAEPAERSTGAKRTTAENAERDEFVGAMAHELRNPLGPLRNAIHLLQLTTPIEPRVKHLHDIIDRQVTHMTHLVDDLLESTRLARGQIPLRRERCDLARIVRQAAEDYRSILDASGLKLAIDIPDAPLWMDGDPTRLVQAIVNLLHNAHKFTDAGGLIAVGLARQSDERTATIIVRDTGIGIEPTLLAHIFDGARRTAAGSVRKRGGLGIGLALVKRLMELHDGQVAVASDGLGKGATFTIRLPVR